MDIDFVVLWVDGSDPEWIKEKEKYAPVKPDDGNSAGRYRDLGLLKYWFRSVEAFTPWFHKIHFVTWGHLPSFLNTDNPKLNIVKHSDFIPSEWLPTFSSHAIEMNVHRIKGLSDHFVYFNDDTFVVRPLDENYFFKNGLPCAHVAEVPLGFIGKPETWLAAAANGMGIINSHFSKKNQERKYRSKYLNTEYYWYDNLRTLLFGMLIPDYYTGFKNYHCPAPFLKSTFNELWEQESEILELTSSHKFRDREDVNQWVAQWWQIAKGDFTPRKTKAAKFFMTADSIEMITEALSSSKYDMICISDPDSFTDYEEEKEILSSVQSAFEKLLPEKSSFER